jgi:hypothetical protein
MNSMDDRWNNCARAARTAPQETPPPVPHGFALRALRSARSSIEGATLDIWTALSRRALAFSITAIILAASLLWWEEPGDAIAPPAVADDAIQQALWLP